MKSLSFDSLVRLYDKTRTFDQGCFDAALDYLANRFPPQTFGHVFEPGIGNGRIAIPLAERGYRVMGVDISQEMLALLKERLAQCRQPTTVTFQQADTTRLPFPNATFDLAIAVHLFYFIRDWQQAAAELLRVVRDDGAIVLMHTGTGAEIPFLNERYQALCAEQGCTISAVGVKSTRQVVDYYRSLGCQAEWTRDRWPWVSRLQLDEALGYIKSRAYSFTTVAPDDVHTTAIEKLKYELHNRFGCLTAEVEVLNQIYLVEIFPP